MENKIEFSVKEFAKLCNVSPRTLKYYEEIGLLQPKRKDQNGYRIYHISQLDDVSMILLYKDYGFSLKEISDVMKQKDLESQYQRIQFQKQIIQEKLRQLEDKKQLIDYTLSQFNKAFQMMNKPFIDENFSQVIEPYYFNLEDFNVLIVNYLTNGFKSGIIFDPHLNKLIGDYQTTSKGSLYLKGKILVLYHQGNPSKWIEPINQMKEYADEHQIPLSHIYNEIIFESQDVENCLIKYFMMVNQ